MLVVGLHSWVPTISVIVLHFRLVLMQALHLVPTKYHQPSLMHQINLLGGVQRDVMSLVCTFFNETLGISSSCISTDRKSFTACEVVIS